MYTVGVIALLAVLAVCVIPRAPRRHQDFDTLFVAGGLIFAAFLLIVPPVYEWINGLLPLRNWPDLIAKLCLFLGVAVAAGRICRALGSARAERLLVGVPGRCVLILAFGSEIALFVAVHSTRVSSDLQLDFGSPLARMYSATAVAYTAYIAIVVLPSVLRATRGTSRTERITGALLTIGFLAALSRAAIAALTVVQPDLFLIGQVVSLVVALCVSVGLAVAWFSARWGGRRALLPDLLSD